MILHICFSISAFAFTLAVMLSMEAILNYEPVSNKLLILLGLLLCTASRMVLGLPNDSYLRIIKVTVALFSILLPPAVYCFMFKRMKLNILYMYALGIVINENSASLLNFVINREQRELLYTCAYALTALVLLLLIKIFRYKKWITVIQSNIRVIPVRLYIAVLAYLYIMSCFEYIAVREDKQFVARCLILPVVLMSIIIVTWVIKVSISEREHQNVSKLLEVQLNNQLEHYNKINDIYSEFRAFRHDLNNHLIALRSYINDNTIEEALAYIDEISHRTLITKKSYDTGNIMADALLNDKNDKAADCNTHITFSGFVPTMGITSPDLCTIMANALDNAIEACAKDKSDSRKEIKVDSDFRQGYFLFRVTNPVFDKVEIKHGNQVRTSKEDSSLHGFGVANIVKAVEKYSGRTELSVNNGEFILDVELMLEQNI